MNKRQIVTPLPGPLEDYAREFDQLFSRVNQREGFRQYIAGLLLPAVRNKMLTGLANAEPIVDAQSARVQSLQWFLSESSWDAVEVNKRRLALLLEHPNLSPHGQGALVIDETGEGCADVPFVKMDTTPRMSGDNTRLTLAKSRMVSCRSPVCGPMKTYTIPLK